ncbi:hypothetical protein GNI_093490 [Gregarina niphandrodes]|uniref:Uncharacterized protein n=1 Tax=Gregarina niphandrodes TaxID=110365 RepID=A0A023B5C1_GRENI|nr:hypothetical protein GNI_093490 [Gregarina niphandrodes]EZG58896.1 hypothetical protein GNI_093490 [Gregarina niphandrodes]|eukprot:XP_011130927.1 hypothetical protein GNI_093490 [Gregarina niphandrodes]
MNRVAAVIASRNEQHSALIGRYVKPIYMAMRKEIETRPVVVESVMNNLAATVDSLSCPDSGATLSLYTSALEDYKKYPQHSYLFKMLLSLSKLVPPQTVVRLIPVIESPLDRRLAFLSNISPRFNKSITDHNVTFRQWQIVRDAVVEVITRISNQYLDQYRVQDGAHEMVCAEAPLSPTSSTPDGVLDSTTTTVVEEVDATMLEGIASLLSTYYMRDETVMTTIDTYAAMLAQRILQIDARTKANDKTTVGTTPADGEEYDFEMEYEEEPYEVCGEESFLPYLMELLNILKHTPMNKLSRNAQTTIHAVRTNISVPHSDLSQEFQTIWDRKDVLPIFSGPTSGTDASGTDASGTDASGTDKCVGEHSMTNVPAGLVSNATMGEGPDWATVEEMEAALREMEAGVSRLAVSGLSVEQLCHIAKSKESFVKVLDMGGGQTIKTDTALQVRLRALRLLKTLVRDRAPSVAGHVDAVMDAVYYAVGDDVGHETYELGYAILLEFLDRYRCVPPVPDTANNCAGAVTKLVNVTKAVIAYIRFGDKNQDDLATQAAAKERTRQSQIMADILSHWTKDTEL